jgi:hypothetical protein
MTVLHGLNLQVNSIHWQWEKTMKESNQILVTKSSHGKGSGDIDKDVMPFILAFA